MLRLVAAVSGLYDILLGAGLLWARPLLQQFFDVPAPSPAIHADLNGLFALAIGIGYGLPLRDPVRYRAYLWLMGPGLKGVGAVWIAGDVLLRGSPPAFLAFAVGDGTLAFATWLALVASRPQS